MQDDLEISGPIQMIGNDIICCTLRVLYCVFSAVLNSPLFAQNQQLFA